MGYTEKVTTEVEIKILPCVKCGSNDVELDNCGYSSFDVAWGKCLKCGNEVKISPCSFPTKRMIAEKWNKANDPVILKSEYEKQIAELQKKISELP